MAHVPDADLSQDEVQFRGEVQDEVRDEARDAGEGEDEGDRFRRRKYTYRWRNSRAYPSNWVVRPEDKRRIRLARR